MNKKRKAHTRDSGAQSTVFRIVAHFGSYAEQISPRKVDYKGMTIVSGGKIITSTTFCLRLGISANQQAPCSPLLLPIAALDISTRPGWPSYFVSWVSVKGQRGTKSEKTVMHPSHPHHRYGRFGSARRPLVPAMAVTVRTAAADATASAVAGVIW